MPQRFHLKVQVFQRTANPTKYKLLSSWSVALFSLERCFFLIFSQRSLPCFLSPPNLLPAQSEDPPPGSHRACWSLPAQGTSTHVPQPQPRIQCVQAPVPLPLCPLPPLGPTRDPHLPCPLVLPPSLPQAENWGFPGLLCLLPTLSGCCARSFSLLPSPGCHSSGVPLPQGAGPSSGPPSGSPHSCC